MSSRTRGRPLTQQLRAEHICLLKEDELDEEQQQYVRTFFRQQLSGFVSPVWISAVKQLADETDENIYLAVKMQAEHKKQAEYALIELPVSVCGRFVRLPDKNGNNYLMYLDDVIRFCLPIIFSGLNYDHFEAYAFKFTKDAEMEIDNDLRNGMLQKISKGVKSRRKGDALRVIYDAAMPKDLHKRVMNMLNLDKLDTVLAGGRYHNHKDLMSFPDCGRKDLKYPRWEPLVRPELDSGESLLRLVQKGDRFIHVPYHSFDYYIRLLQEAAIHKEVKSIKTTLYRLAKDSKVVRALICAARNGKKVTVVIELLARFDEASNISWSKKMQDAGILHFLRPADVGRLVEAGQQFDDDRHLLAVTGGTDKGAHHFRVLGQAVERGLDTLHLLMDGGLLQEADVVVEAMVRHVDEAVALLHQPQQALAAIQFRTYQGFPTWVFQVLPAAIGEGHQVFVVMITTSGQHRVQLVEIQHVHHTLVQVFRHGGVVDDAQGIAFPPTLHSLGYLLQHAVTQVVVYLHLGILRKLEGVRFEVVVVQSAEDDRKTESDDIVQVHQVVVAVLVGQSHKTSADRNRQFDQSILGLLLMFGLHLDGQVDVLVRFVGQLLHRRNPHGTDKSAQLLAEERTHILLLLFVKFILLQKADMLGTQLLSQRSPPCPRRHP